MFLQLVVLAIGALGVMRRGYNYQISRDGVMGRAFDDQILG